MQNHEHREVRRNGESHSEPLRLIAEALDRLRYGAIQLTVHDGKVMQVDVTERRRFGQS